VIGQIIAATDSTLVAAWLSLAGVFVATGGTIALALFKMKRSNTADHDEVITMVRAVVIGQEQLYQVVDRHISQHDEFSHQHGAPDMASSTVKDS
jgi:hypothetical protein